MLCKWIKKLKNYRVKKEKPSNPYGIIIPHISLAQGAESPKGVSEYKYALSMMDYIGLPFSLRDHHGVAGATKDLIKQGATKTI